MQPWVVFLIIAAVVAVFWLAQHFGWIDLSNKSKTSGSGGIAGIGDEVFHPTRHEAQIEMDRQTVLPAPAPLPGDGDKGVAADKNYRGQVKIDLSERR